MNSLFSPSFAMKQNRRFQNQQPFAPVITQQPIVTDQQYSQPLNQQYNQPLNQQSQCKKKILNFNSERKIFCFCFLASVFQGMPQRAKLPIFQSPPSRFVKNFEYTIHIIILSSIDRTKLKYF